MDAAELQGWALVIGAVGIAVPAILGAINSFKNTAKIAEVHDLVNGQSEKITRLAEAKGYAEGVADSPTEQKQPPPVST